MLGHFLDRPIGACDKGFMTDRIHHHPEASSPVDDAAPRAIPFTVVEHPDETPLHGEEEEIAMLHRELRGQIRQVSDLRRELAAAIERATARGRLLRRARSHVPFIGPAADLREAIDQELLRVAGNIRKRLG